LSQESGHGAATAECDAELGTLIADA
jgi:hypothetical protein